MSCPHCYHQGRVSWRLEIRQYGSSPNQPEEHNSPCLSSKYIHCLVTWNMSISPWLYAQLHVCQHALSAKILLNCQLKGTNLFLRKASHGSPWLTSFSSLNVSLGCAPAFFVLAIPLQQRQKCGRRPQAVRFPDRHWIWERGQQKDEKMLFISQLLNIPTRLFRVCGAFSARTLSSYILVKDAESLKLPQENVTVFVSQFFFWRCGILLIWDLSL